MDILTNRNVKLDLVIEQILNWINTKKYPIIILFILSIAWYWYLITGLVFWRDEAHSLLIARANPDLFNLFKAIRYEGTPGLWFLILWIAGKFVALTPLVAKAIHFIFFLSFLIILLFLIKIPNIIKLFILLQFPIIYNAVYIRQYQIVATLILLFSYLYINIERKNNIWFYVVLFFLAQTCLHGLIISIGLFLLLFLNNYHRNNEIFSKYYIIAIIGIILSVVQMIPPFDSIANTSTWNLSFTLDKFFGVRNGIITDVFLNNFILELGLIIGFFIILNRAFQKSKPYFVNFIISFLIMLLCFFMVGLMKYSLLRHHLLLTYVLISFIIIVIHYVKEKVQKNKWIYIILLPLLIISLLQFINKTYIYKRQLRSHSKNVVSFLDKNYPTEEILTMSEIFEEPIRLYRKKQVPVYALGRQKYVKYTVWNDWNVDHTKNPLATHIRISQVIKKLNSTPREILIKKPILVLAGYDPLSKMNDLDLSTLKTIKINDDFQLEFIKAFIGAQEENYYLYLLNCREEY